MWRRVEGSPGIVSLSRPPRVFPVLVSSNDGKREIWLPRQIPLGWDLRDEKGQEAFFAASGSSLMSPDVPPNFQAGSTKVVILKNEKLFSLSLSLDGGSDSCEKVSTLIFLRRSKIIRISIY